MEQKAQKVAMGVALGLSLTLVVGVLIGAKVVFDRAAHQPVPLSTVDGPAASSPECAAVVAALPETLAGHRRAQLADPVPAGAAAWQSSSVERVTLRCGVSAPLQYTALASISEDGWLFVDDATPGSTLRTAYNVAHPQVVALTADGQSLPDDASWQEALGQLASSLDQLADDAIEPFAVPLAGLPTSGSAWCGRVIDALGEDIDGFVRHPGADAAWVRAGSEPIVVACGTEFPASYAPGARLTQINDATWFEDTTLGNGTTASTWFVLNAPEVVAVSVPQSSGNAAVVAVSEAIAAAGA